MLADPRLALAIPDDAIVTHAVMILEWMRTDPDAVDVTRQRASLAFATDDDAPPWLVRGMLAQADALEIDAVSDDDDG
jgi:hypothetical protein